jgi:hypothetical protein
MKTGVAMKEIRAYKKGEKDTGQLLVRVGAQNNWMALRSPSWSTAASGRWYRQTNSTKFRQFSYIVLIDTSSKSVASLPEFPYAPGSKFVIGQAETVTFEFYDPKNPGNGHLPVQGRWT